MYFLTQSFVCMCFSFPCQQFIDSMLAMVMAITIAIIFNTLNIPIGYCSVYEPWRKSSRQQGLQNHHRSLNDHSLNPGQARTISSDLVPTVSVVHTVTQERLHVRFSKHLKNQPVNPCQSHHGSSTRFNVK